MPPGEHREFNGCRGVTIFLFAGTTYKRLLKIEQLGLNKVKTHAAVSSCSSLASRRALDHAEAVQAAQRC